ncbi:MAG TPA: ABC transporter substrate-binding protein [Thermodesulfobacteriota bacterium]|nr:ABC transporter substrate-binding protein [Thermodesulfobacteriota bacterium]
MKKSLVVLLIALAALKLSPGSGFAATPRETIESQVDRALEVLRDPALKAESAKAAKEKKIWAILDGVFDYTELSKRTLAQNWKRFSPDQQAEFTRLFGKLLGTVYMDRIIAYKDEKVVFGKVTNLSDKTAEVQSEVVRSSKPIPIHYRMILESGEWRVYDVVVEGVSLVQNYRSQFREILMNKTPEDLLKTLREKTQK